MSIVEVQARITALSTRLDTLGLRPGAAVDPAAGDAFRASLGEAVAGQGLAGGLGAGSASSSGLLPGSTATAQGLGLRPGWAATTGAAGAAGGPAGSGVGVGAVSGAGATDAAVSGSTGGPYGAAFAAATARYDLPPGLLRAVAQRESGLRADAVSPAGARGLMQLMPATAASLGVDPMVPDQAIDGAARYLRQQLDTFGRLDLALAAYNAGPGNVRKHGGIPPFAETRSYVTAVTAALAEPGGTRP